MKKARSLLIGMMLVMTMFAGFLVVMDTVTATVRGVPGEHVTIQDAINNCSAGDIVTVQDGYYAADVLINKSGILVQSANGSALTWINGTVNISVDDVSLGADSSTGFTIHQSTINTVGVNAINISTNGSRDNITIKGCRITGGYDCIHIGRAAGTTDTTTNVLFYDLIISGCGRSAIYSGPGDLQTANFTSIRAYNTSNTVTGAIICCDGGSAFKIYSCNLYNTVTNGGEGINFTGVSNEMNSVQMEKNNIYNVGGYSPIIVRSLSDATQVQNVRIAFNELENSSNPYSEAAVRFDNVSGWITATNISVIFNNIDTTGYDIEERIITAYSNWSGTMHAYLNWYGTNTGPTLRYSTHLNYDPYLLLSSASGDIWTNTDYLEGTQTAATMNATANCDINLSSITSTADVVIAAYPYGLGGTYCPIPNNFPRRAMHNYKELSISDPSLITFPVNITIYYDVADLAIRGWSESHIGGIMWYNETSTEWAEFNYTRVDTSYSGGGYSGRVWAHAYEQSQITGAVYSIVFNEITTEDDGAAPVDEDVDTGLDSDGDGYTDYQERAAGTDPLDATDYPGAPWSACGYTMWQWIVIGLLISILIIVIVLLSDKKRRKRWFG